MGGGCGGGEVRVKVERIKCHVANPPLGLGFIHEG
jgi:hypothetical protein